MSVNENSIFEYYSLVKSKKINWLWYPYIPFGKLTIIQVDPGCGKSTFILDIIARLTIIDVLKNGITPSSIIIEHVKNCGYSERTINSEKKKLGIKSFRKNGKWFWQLPKELNLLEVEHV